MKTHHPWHGDIDMTQPTHYYCHLHNATHPIQGTCAEWRDLYDAVHKILVLGDRPVNHPNIFRDSGLHHRKTTGHWKPYPGAPISYACAPALRGAHRPMYVALTELVPLLSKEAYEIVRTHAYAQVRQLHTPPKKPREEGRRRIYLHGDLNEALPRWFCSHHNAWHATPAPSPLPGDIHLARRARAYVHDGPREYRPKLPPCAFEIPPSKGRPARLPTDPCELWTCMSHELVTV